MLKPVYLIDLGTLLPTDHPDYAKRTHVYDRQNSYSDKDQHYAVNLMNEVEKARAYVTNGTDNSYAVISRTIVKDTLTDDQIYNMHVNEETYLPEDVLFSIAKIDGEIKENFTYHFIPN